MKKTPRIKTDPRTDLLLQGRLHDPFSFLGLHKEPDGFVLRLFQPYASQINLIGFSSETPLQRVHPDGLFEWRGNEAPAAPYLLQVISDGTASLIHDPYAFMPQINSFDLHLFNEGRLHQGYRVLGSRLAKVSGIEG